MLIIIIIFVARSNLVYVYKKALESTGKFWNCFLAQLVRSIPFPFLSFILSRAKCNFSSVWNKLLLSASHIGFGPELPSDLGREGAPGPGKERGQRGFSKFGVIPGMVDYIIWKANKVLTVSVGRITVLNCSNSERSSDWFTGENVLTWLDVMMLLAVLENRLWQSWKEEGGWGGDQE